MVKIVGKRKLSDSYLINLTCFWADIPYGVKISLHSSLSTINSSSHYSIPESFNSSFYSLVSSICILQNQDPLGFESGHI